MLRFRAHHLLVFVLITLPLIAQAPTDTITIDAAAPAHPFPHYWEQMFGSGRAVLSLRAEYRSDLRAVHQITAMQYVRFHAILDDDVGVYDEDKQGKLIYNFSYVDQIYDGLLANNVKPFVELSFMPYKLAARPDLQSFWYHPNIAPPKDYTKWDDLVTQFTNISSSATVSTRLQTGTSKYGMSRIWTSGAARPSSKPTSSFTITPRATSRR